MAVLLALDRPRQEQRWTEKPREAKVEFGAREVRGKKSGNAQRSGGKSGAGFDGVRRMLAVAEEQAKTIEITSQIVPCLTLWLSAVLLIFLWFAGGRRTRNKGTLERRSEENFLHAQQVGTEQSLVIRAGFELEYFTHDPAVFTPEGLIPESCPPLERSQRRSGIADGSAGVPAEDEVWVQADWKPYIVAVSVLDKNLFKARIRTESFAAQTQDHNLVLDLSSV
jgi:hypothetical protein